MVVITISYRLLEEIAIADACFELSGKTLEELFHAGFLALMETSVELHTVEGSLSKTLSLEHKDPERLLYEFLEELIFLKDAELLIFNECQLKIEKDSKKSTFKLIANLKGQEFSETVSTVTDVKAITYYQFFVKQTKDGWIAQVTFDL
jgi:SHS2 domain-containing protein